MNDLTVVARSPQDVRTQHGSLKEWVHRQLDETNSELSEINGLLEKAKRQKFGTKDIAKHQKKIIAYKKFLIKIFAAIQAGYTIIPNFDIESLAVRSDGRTVAGNKHYSPPIHGAMKLEIGKGRYVSPEPEFESWTQAGKDYHGEAITETFYYATKNAPVPMPLFLARTQLAETLMSAMKEKLFDEIGIVNGKRQHQTHRVPVSAQTATGIDPILVGRILHPKASQWNKRMVTFFLGWWMDTKMLQP